MHVKMLMVCNQMSESVFRKCFVTCVCAHRFAHQNVWNRFIEAVNSASAHETFPKSIQNIQIWAETKQITFVKEFDDHAKTEKMVAIALILFNMFRFQMDFPFWFVLECNGT